MRDVVELETLSAPALSRLIDRGGSVVVVPFGSIEHQAEHLPIGADAIVADAVGREVARRLGAVLARTVRIGCAEQHRQLTGTITLRTSTLTHVAVDLGESLARQGFMVIVLLSTHGGNRAALDTAVARLETSLDGPLVCAPRGDVGPRPGAHSGAWLTSVMLALRPDLVDAERASAELMDEVRSADARHGARHLERFVASVVHDVRTTMGVDR
jgi:creatinine amidohydrolase